jgi:uncharacterized protein YukE
MQITIEHVGFTLKDKRQLAMIENLGIDFLPGDNLNIALKELKAITSSVSALHQKERSLHSSTREKLINELRAGAGNWKRGSMSMRYDTETHAYHATVIKDNDVMHCVSNQVRGIHSLLEELDAAETIRQKHALKTRIIFHAYTTELRNAITSKGVAVVKNFHIMKSLRLADYNLEGALSYAMENIYTPLKRNMINKGVLGKMLRKLLEEKLKLSSEVNDDDSGDEDPTTLAELKEKAERVEVLDEQIKALKKSMSMLDEEREVELDDLISRLKACGAPPRRTRKSYVSHLLSNRFYWNDKETYNYIVKHYSGTQDRRK